MANKFTKSVLERQAKEMRQHPVRAAKPAGEGETAAPETPAVEPIAQAAPAAIPAEQPEATAAPAPTAAEAPAAQPAPRARAARQPKPAAPPVDLTEFIVRDEGRAAPRGGGPKGDRQQAGQRHPAEDFGALTCKADLFYSSFGSPHGPLSPKLGTVAQETPSLSAIFSRSLRIPSVFYAICFYRRMGACP